MIDIGNRIRNVRKDKDITLIELSKLTGVAQATLSRIETGDMLGTVDCHQRVANALGMSLSELYEGVDERASKTHHAKKSDGQIISAQGDRIKIELRTSKALKKKLFPLVIHLNKQEFPLKEDESLYFDGSLPHRIINKSSKTAKVISVSSPPA